MRFSVEPGWDLEVTEGTTLGACREVLAELTGVPVDVPLSAAGVVLADGHVAGVRPWVAGSRLTAGPSPAPPPAATDWRVVVVAGPDAGAVGTPAGGRLVVGRGGGAGPGALPLHDARVSRRHAAVRRVGPWWFVRRLGPAPVVRVRRARWGRWSERRRRVLVAAVIRPGDWFALGAGVLELRRTAGRTAPGPAPVERPAAGTGDVPGRSSSLATALVPLVVGLALAAVTRSPVYLLLAVAGPATAVLTRAADRRGARRRPGPPDLGPDPDACRSAVRARPAWWATAADGLVVRGGEPAVAAARALVGAALLAPDVHVTLLLDPARTGDWAWCRWLGPRLRVGDAGGPGPAPAGFATRLVVVDGPASRVALERWWLRGRAPSDAVVVLARSAAEVPAWCAWSLDAGVDGRGGLTGPGRTPVQVDVPMGGLAWAEDHARTLAAADAARTDAGMTDPPAVVSLADVGLPLEARAVGARWGRVDGPPEADAGSPASPAAPAALVVPIGVGGRGVVRLDLDADGPHALVAGTTGSGKSELLQSLVLAVALSHPPRRVEMVLLDFKGGAGVGRCAALPHVAGAVTDLDAGEAARALEALRTELRRREHVVAAAGVADARQTDLPRLLVVVDEFQALAEDLPDFVPTLVRLAAQGRSLGLHLVLATQRPAGAVTPQMRANLALRVCLRVTEVADSMDVVEDAAAAHLPADRPGRAVLRRGGGAVEVVQAPWATLAPGRAPSLRRAARWGSEPQDAAGASAPTRDHLPDLLTAVRDAAGAARAAALWAPALPTSVHRAELPPAPRGPAPAAPAVPAAPPGPAEPAVHDGQPAALSIGLTDPPGARAHGLLAWAPSGVLAVAGARGSGRTTALAVVAQAALASGHEVHVVSSAPLAPDLARSLAAPGLGTVVTTSDPRRLTRLLTLLTGRAARPCLVLVDDVGSVARALDAVPRGLGTELLERLLRDGGHHGAAVVVGGEPRDVTRWAAAATWRLVLPVADRGDEALLGVPAGLTGRSRSAGRAVCVRPEGAVPCQVALPDPAPPAAAAPVPAPVRLAPIPRTVRPEPARSTGWAVAVGVGGDDAGPLLVDVSGGLLVAGPPGSGRSTALAGIVRCLVGAGLRVAVIGDVGGVRPADVVGPARNPAEVAALVEQCSTGGADVLVVDDADLLARTDPALDDTLAAWVAERRAGVAHRPVLVAAARTDRAAAAYRGLAAALRGTTTIVLAPLEPGSADVAGTDLAPAADPALPRHPGRGVVVRAGRATPLQVSAW